jgi:hypothetical protein
VAFVAKVLAIHVFQTNPVRESTVLFDIPPRRLVKAVVWVVMTMRIMVTTAKEFSMVIE